MDKIIRQLYAQATLLGACGLFTGQEKTLEQLVELFTSPQGQEFCIENRFPNIATVRLFKEYGVERFGIYIDAGVISLKNPKRAVLIGRTSATINIDTLARHEITFMHGARGTVNASKWAVARVKVAQGCNVIKNVFNNAIIL